MPTTALAQPQGKAWRIGFLSSESADRFANRVEAFRTGLSERGYDERKNIIIEFRWADGKSDRLPELAKELVRLNVDIIVTHGTVPLRAVMNATKSIPIVTASSGDLVAQGFLSSLSRPGGNMTGAMFFTTELAAKRVELLRDALPTVSHVGVILNADGPGTPLSLKAMESTAQSRKLTLHPFYVRERSEFESAFASMAKRKLGAVAIPDTPLFISNPVALAELALRLRLPSIGPSDVAFAGGLMSYGVDFPAMWRRAANFVDKILKGEQPGNIPVEQPTKFDLVLNMKTAKALGLKIPQSILVQATKVIE